MPDNTELPPVSTPEAASPAPSANPVVEAAPSESSKGAADSAQPVKTGEPEAASQTEPTPDPKTSEPAQSDEPAPRPTFEPFQLPEGVQVEAESLTQFANDLAEFERAHNVPHDVMQKFGQDLVSKYATQTQETLQRISAAQTAAWESTTNGWKDALEKDPELGGNRLDTTAQNLQRAVENYAGNEGQRKEFQEFMETYKVGNHPALVRFVNNLVSKIDSYESETARPLTATALAPKTKSMVERRYGKTG